MSIKKRKFEPWEIAFIILAYPTEDLDVICLILKRNKAGIIRKASILKVKRAHLTPEEINKRHKESRRKWREKNPDKVQSSNRKRIYNSTKAKLKYKEKMAIPEYRKKVYAKLKERKDKVYEFLNEYKISHGCIDCGYNKHPVALDFDHVRGVKEMQLSHAKTVEQAKIEIEKCEVRCANCHRIKTYERLHNKEI